MTYYGLFWMWSPYLDLRWRSRSTGTIPELLITSIVRHKNKNSWVGDPMWRSCSLFCVMIFHSSFRLVKYPNTKQFTWSPQGIPPFTCSCYNIFRQSKMWGTPLSVIIRGGVSPTPYSLHLPIVVNNVWPVRGSFISWVKLLFPCVSISINNNTTDIYVYRLALNDFTSSYAELL